MKGLIHYILRPTALLVMLLAFASCSHETSIVDGPLLTNRFGPFVQLEPLEASVQTVDFATGQRASFTAVFSKEVEWTLEIRGDESGALKRIEGFSRELNAENSSWDGSTTELPFFKAETVTASLIVDDPDAGDPVSTGLEVLSPRSYPGSLFANFEAPDTRTAEVRDFEFDLNTTDTGVSSEVPAGEGNNFLLLRTNGGQPVADAFFDGLVNIYPSENRAGLFSIPSSIPEDIHLNFFLYSFGSPLSLANIEIVVDGNGNEQYDEGTDPIVAATGGISVNWDAGWRAFSFTLAELGLTEEQAGQIVAIRAIALNQADQQPDPNNHEVSEYGIDFITFTVGGPLEL